MSDTGENDMEMEGGRRRSSRRRSGRRRSGRRRRSRLSMPMSDRSHRRSQRRSHRRARALWGGAPEDVAPEGVGPGTTLGSSPLQGGYRRSRRRRRR